MQALYDLVEQIAPYDVPVLITGEQGAGKERIADAIQHLSDRRAGPYVKVNCAALSPTTGECELFGHKRGGLHSATEDRHGHFGEADGGTLLLDEVGELCAPLQAKLVRAVQEGEVQRMGDDQIRKVNVRIIAATNRPIEEDVLSGAFREDLYYRLAGVRVHAAPLRERTEDIPLLAEYFLAGFVKDSEARGRSRPIPRLGVAALQALLTHPWRGNVRELENVLRLAFMRAPPGHEIGPEALTLTSSGKTTAPREDLNLANIERSAIQKAMDRSAQNVTAAAKLLGIDRTTLWRKLKETGENPIDPR